VLRGFLFGLHAREEQTMKGISNASEQQSNLGRAEQVRANLLRLLQLLAKDVAQSLNRGRGVQRQTPSKNSRDSTAPRS
jgi:hypothetical protein